MKSRFMATAICLVLVLTVLPLAAGSDGGLLKTVYAAPMSVTGPETPIVVNQYDTSIYDGTYSGTFHYVYRVNRLEQMPGQEYKKYVKGNWTSASISLTVTLKTLFSGGTGVLQPFMSGGIFADPNIANAMGLADSTTVQVTSVSCNDPNFGNSLSATSVSGGPLPAKPPTTPTNPSLAGMGLGIFFSNGATITTSAELSPGILSVSAGGQTLSGSTWLAYGTASGPFSNEVLYGYAWDEDAGNFFDPLFGWAKYDVEFKSWSLTKVASSSITAMTKEDQAKLEALAKDYQARLDAAIDAKDIQGILRAWRMLEAGLVSGQELTRLREKSIAGITEANQARLNTAIQKKDIQGILEVLKFQMNTGLIPEREATQQYNKQRQGILDVNQERLDAAIKAKDANRIREAISVAMIPAGLDEARVPEDQAEEQAKIEAKIQAQAQAQIKKGEEELAKLGEPPEIPPAKSTGPAVLTGKSGEVEVWKGGAVQPTKDDQTALKSGDEVRTGENSKAYIAYSDSYELTLGPTTTITIVDLDKGIDLLLGKIKLSIQQWFIKRFEVRTPVAIAAVRGTEFTLSVDKDGTTTVMVLDGFVEVQDRISNSTILLSPPDMITLPNIPGGLTQQDMYGRIQVIRPESIDRWWEKDPAATGKQPVQSPWGIVTVALAAAAVIFLVAGRVFALLLRRRYGRSPS